MRRMILGSVAVLALAAAGVRGQAASSSAPAAAAAGGVAPGETLTGYLDAKTVLVGRADVTKVDMDALEKWELDLLKQAGVLKPEEVADIEKEVHEAFGEAKRWVGEFKEARGTEIYLVGRSDTMFRNGPGLVIPVGEKGNSDQLVSLMNTGKKDKPAAGGPQRRVGNGQPTAEFVADRKAVMWGMPATRTGLKGAKGGARAEVVAALTETGGPPVQLVVVPDDAFRNQVLQNLPPQILGRPKAEIVNAVTWVGGWSQVPPEGTAKVIVQAKDAAAQQALSQVIVTGLMMMKGLGGKQGMPADMQPIIDALTPLPADGNKLVVDVDRAKALAVAKVMAPVFQRQRAVALRVKSMSNMRQILVACAMYSAEHKGEWPDKLDQLGKQFQGEKIMQQSMTNPQDPQRKNAYTYMKPKTPVRQPNQQVVLYEAHEKFGQGVNVGFADGHVEFVGQEQRYKDLMLQSMEENSADQ